MLSTPVVEQQWVLSKETAKWSEFSNSRSVLGANLEGVYLETIFGGEFFIAFFATVLRFHSAFFSMEFHVGFVFIRAMTVVTFVGIF